MHDGKFSEGDSGALLPVGKRVLLNRLPRNLLLALALLLDVLGNILDRSIAVTDSLEDSRAGGNAKRCGQGMNGGASWLDIVEEANDGLSG